MTGGQWLGRVSTASIQTRGIKLREIRSLVNISAERLLEFLLSKIIVFFLAIYFLSQWQMPGKDIKLF